MSATFRYTEQVWDYTPATAKSAGDIVLLGTDTDVVGVVVADLAANELGAIRVTGACDFTTAVTDFAQGDAAYYDSVTGTITDDNTDTYAGRVTEQISSTVIRVAINFMFAPAGS